MKRKLERLWRNNKGKLDRAVSSYNTISPENDSPQKVREKSEPEGKQELINKAKGDSDGAIN